MRFLKKLFWRDLDKGRASAQSIRITLDNIGLWVKIEKAFREGKIKSDSNGRLRYLHGAPVGDMILTGVDRDGVPIYKESTEEWFDEESQSARDFIWP